MKSVEDFIMLFFLAIIIGIVVTNGKGVSALFTGITSLSQGLINAFSGGKGFRGSSF